MSQFSLHRDEEEDLIDYGDSDVEAETTEEMVTIAIEEIDIFADDATYLRAPAQSARPDHTTDYAEESPKEPTRDPKEESTGQKVVQQAALLATQNPLTTTKTVEAASVIKALNELLTNAKFRVALGLIEPGSSLNLTFWADRLDFALSLRLIGAAEVKMCRHGVECRSKDCTFDHSGADRSAIVAGKKSRKLCSKVNTVTGCAKGDACWFSHEALGSACADGDLRATCAKGPYCVYKHNDDEAVPSIQCIEQAQEEPANGEETIEGDALAPSRSVGSPTPAETDDAPTMPAPSTNMSPKQQARGVKRGRNPTEEAHGRPEKAQHMEQRQIRREHSGLRGYRERSTPQRAGPDISNHSHRGSGSGGRSIRGDRGGKCGKGGWRSVMYHPFETRQHGGYNQLKKGPLEQRMTRS